MNSLSEISRKKFLKQLLLIGIATQMPVLQACSEDNENDIFFKNISPLSQKEFKILRKLLEVLFPKDNNGPSALEVNADKYIVWVLNDKLLDKKENDYIIKHLSSLDNASIEKYNIPFLDLSSNDINDFIKEYSNIKWSKAWFSRLLTLIFEALLLDPIYGGNPNNIAWNWLEHNPGEPRPTEDISYPKLLNI